MTAFAHYDAIATWYDEQIRDGGLVHDLLLPSLLELVGDIAGQQVCDLACGQGVVARLLAERGGYVTGIDISAALLTIARAYESAASLGISYRQDDAQHLATMPDGAFDGIACNMALHDIPDLAACARAVTAGQTHLRVRWENGGLGRCRPARRSLPCPPGPPASASTSGRCPTRAWSERGHTGSSTS